MIDVDFQANLLIALMSFILTTLASILTILWQLKHQHLQTYKATIRMVLSEVKENSRVLGSGEKFTLTLDGNDYRILLTLLGTTGLEGCISSERISYTKSHTLLSNLVLLLRKMQLHNSISALLQECVGEKEPNITYLMWLIENLESKQKILQQDLIVMTKALEQETVQKHGSWRLNSFTPLARNK